MYSKNLFLVILMLFSISVTTYANEMDIATSVINYDEFVKDSERSIDLPFNETWDSGDFETNLWSFDPLNPGNWQIITDDLPWPVHYAEFQSLPAQTNYAIALVSSPFNGVNESDIYLKYNLELSSAVNTGEEELSVEIFNGLEWFEVMNYSNSEGDFEFSGEGVDISEYACGVDFQIKFTVQGNNSEDINYWILDQINIGSPPPGGISGTVTNSDTGAPVCDAQVAAGIYSGITNESGEFTINYLSPGIYDLIVSKNGYEEVIVHEVTVETGEYTIVDLTISQLSYCNLPFNEHWNSGDFSTNLWTLDPLEQSNWQAVTDYLPWPVHYAEFSGAPVLENYSNSLISNPLNGIDHDTVILDYRLDLASMENTGAEMFRVEINNGSDWIELMTYDNSAGDFDNLTESVDISEYAAEHQFMIKFTASGINSLDIDYWHLDYVDIHSPLPGSIIGQVFDAETGENIAEAVITIGDWQITSDSFGFYNITDIAPGTYDLICNADGYNELIESGVVILSNEITTLDIQLEAGDSGQWDVYDLTNSDIPADDVYAVLTAPDNAKWVGTFSGGLACYEDESWQCYYNNYATIRCLAREDNGNIWIGSGNGAAVYDGTNWTEYTYGSTPIPYPVVTEITIDADNVKWFGTGFGGMASFNGLSWNVFDTGNSQLPDNIVYTINIDADNVKWIGTQWGGLTSYNGSEWVSYNTENSGIPVNTVYDIKFDDDNNIWMATFGGGVACFDGSSWSVYNIDNSNLPSNYTQEILIDEQNNIWVGTEEGLAKFDGEAWYCYNSTNSGLPADNILSLQLDAESRLWIGTYEGGLCCYQESALGSVTGTVTDAETGEVIEDAVITDGYFTLAETGTDGLFCFDKIPGDYSIHCYAAGYDNSAVEVVEIACDGQITINFQLALLTGSDEEQMNPIFNELRANYPNPFNPETKIEFSISDESEAEVIIYNIKGQKVRTLVSEKLSPGNYSILWNGKDDSINSVASGIYLYRLKLNNYDEIRKMTLLK